MSANMFTYSLYICDKIIRIYSEHGKFIRFCRGYIIQEPAPEPDITIYIHEDEVHECVKASTEYGVDMMEGFVILRKLSEYLLEKDKTIFVHGSVVAYKNSAFMFTANSGVGKTTHSRLWLSNLSDAFILNGDKPFISTEEEIKAWGSPWCGSERYNKNIGVPLKAICLVERAENNSIKEISFEDALPRLSIQVGNPNIKNDAYRPMILGALYSLREKIKFYDFKMNNCKEDAFETSYQVLSGLE